MIEPIYYAGKENVNELVGRYHGLRKRYNVATERRSISNSSHTQSESQICG